jgi:hypothetical protein
MLTLDGMTSWGRTSHSATDAPLLDGFIYTVVVHGIHLDALRIPKVHDAKNTRTLNSAKVKRKTIGQDEESRSQKLIREARRTI